MVSLAIHGIIMLIASAVYIVQTVRFIDCYGDRIPNRKDAVSVEIFSPTRPPRPQVRAGRIPLLVRWRMPIDRSVLIAEDVQVQPRGPATTILRPTSAGHPQTILEFSNKVVKLDSPMQIVIPPQLNPPNGVRPASSVQRESLPVRAPAAAKIGAVSGTSGIVQVQVAFERPAGLTMVEHIGAPRDASGNVAVPPLNPPNDEAYHDMFFKGSGTNPFIDTEDDHLSTFAMDVDTGSYSITRRYLTDGYLPPPEAVRVEEFVNTFDYNYDPPTEDAFAIHIDGAPSKFGEGKRLQLLRIGLQGRVIPAEHRKDAILTFVIDVSGSMQKENRLGLVKKALTLLVDQLRPTDKVGIVVYGSRGKLVLPHTGIEQRSEILAAINSLAPNGSTNAEEGLRIGYDLAWRNASVNHINRVILCSDGVANVGNTGPDTILKEIRTYVNKGITLSTVGFGMGNYNDVLMEQLADTGDGSYAYVDTLTEAKRIFVENLTGTLQLIAKDAKIQVDFNSEVVSRFRLLGYENRRLDHEQFRDDTVDAGRSRIRASGNRPV